MKKVTTKDKIVQRWGSQYGDGGLMVDLGKLLKVELDLFEEEIRTSEKRTPRLKKRKELAGTSNGFGTTDTTHIKINPKASPDMLKKLGKLLDQFQEENPAITARDLQDYILQRNIKR